MLSLSTKNARLWLAFAVAAFGCSSAGTRSEPSSPAAAPATEKASPPTTPSGGDQSGPWVDGAVARIRVDRGDAGGMRGCTGELTAEAKAFFKTLYAEALQCAKSSPEAPKGSVTFHSTLEVGGGLSEFSVLDDKLGAPKVVECIQMKALASKYPSVAPETPCVQLVHPLTFP